MHAVRCLGGHERRVDKRFSGDVYSNVFVSAISVGVRVCNEKLATDVCRYDLFFEVVVSRRLPCMYTYKYTTPCACISLQQFVIFILVPIIRHVQLSNILLDL